MRSCHVTIIFQKLVVSSVSRETVAVHSLFVVFVEDGGTSRLRRSPLEPLFVLRSSPFLQVLISSILSLV